MDELGFWKSKNHQDRTSLRHIKRQIAQLANVGEYSRPVASGQTNPIAAPGQRAEQELQPHRHRLLHARLRQSATVQGVQVRPQVHDRQERKQDRHIDCQDGRQLLQSRLTEALRENGQLSSQVHNMQSHLKSEKHVARVNTRRTVSAYKRELQVRDQREAGLAREVRRLRRLYSDLTARFNSLGHVRCECRARRSRGPEAEAMVSANGGPKAGDAAELLRMNRALQTSVAVRDDQIRHLRSQIEELRRAQSAELETRKGQIETLRNELARQSELLRRYRQKADSQGRQNVQLEQHVRELTRRLATVGEAGERNRRMGEKMTHRGGTRLNGQVGLAEGEGTHGFVPIQNVKKRRPKRQVTDPSCQYGMRKE